MVLVSSQPTMISELTHLLTSTLKAAKHAREYSWQSAAPGGRGTYLVWTLNTQQLLTRNGHRVETSATTLTPRKDRQPAVGTTLQVHVAGCRDVIDILCTYGGGTPDTPAPL